MTTVVPNPEFQLLIHSPSLRKMIPRSKSSIMLSTSLKLDPKEFQIVDVPPPPDALDMLRRTNRHLSTQHLTLHFPAGPKNCRACRLAKATTAYARCRVLQGVTSTSEDAVERPFGACLHLDRCQMRHGSEAAVSAKFAVSMLEEKTGFKGPALTNSREHEDVLDQVHEYEGVKKDQQSRRWWADCAPEFRAASRAIRTSRPLSHFTSIPR